MVFARIPLMCDKNEPAKQETFDTPVLLHVNYLKGLKSIEHDDPELTPERWFDTQPTARIHIGSKTVILSQPSSTFLVYLLGSLLVAANVRITGLSGALSCWQ